MRAALSSRGLWPGNPVFWIQKNACRIRAASGTNPMRRKILVLALIAGATLVCGAAFSASATGEAQPLSGPGADNLTAFARLLAYVRFFHPSDESAAADWSRVAVAGIGAVEDAPNPASLARALEGFFRPLAPTVRVFLNGERPELDPALRPPVGGGPPRIVAWRHYGGKFDSTARTFHSERIDNLSSPFGTILQAVDPGGLRGRRVRLRARVRAEMKPSGKLQLGLRVDRPGGQLGFLDNMADRPIHTTDWRTIEIQGDVAPDAERIVVLAVLTGEGRVWLDEVSLEPVQGKHETLLANPGFDEGEPGAEPPGWYFPYEESIRAGYHLELRRGEPCLQGGCVELFSDELAAPPRFPRPEEPLEVDLGGGVSALVPLSLYAGARGTLPRPGAGAPPAWSGADPAPDTRDTRLAALLLAWGILAHFHPTLDIPPDDWAAVLRSALPEAAAAGDRETYRRAVLRLLSHVDDPVVSDFEHRDDPPLGWLPLEWEWIEDRLVITDVAPGTAEIRRGDVVLEVDGRPAGEALAAMESIVSAATPEARRWMALAYLNGGFAGTSVSLRLERAGAPPLAVSLRREKTRRTPTDWLLPPVAEPRPGIVYVDLRRIDDQELERQIPRLAKAKGVVFDLRGFAEVSSVLLSHLAPRIVDTLTWEVSVIQRPDRQEVLFLHTVTWLAPRRPRIAGRVAFLADARTMQNSERMLETIEAYGWGEIVGAGTAGNVGNPNWSNLPGGWTIAWTGRRALKHDGKTLLNGTGIRPTVPAARTLRGIAEGRDEVVERAVEIVSQ